jgi:hypothetical protein
MDFLFTPAYTPSSCFEMLKRAEPRKPVTCTGTSGPASLREGPEIFPITGLIPPQR